MAVTFLTDEDKVLRYDEQTLTDEQQAQARANIGASNENGAFVGKTATFYGDSLTQVNYHYTKGYHKWVSEILGLASYKNYGTGGYTVADVYNKVSSASETTDIVFVMCGVNDQTASIPLGEMGDTTTGTTYGALDALCKKTKEKYPLSVIVFVTPHYQTKYVHSAGITSYEISKAIKAVCEKYTIPVYDNFVMSGIYYDNLDFWTTDGCHWNDTAHEMVGKNLAHFMLNTFHYIAKCSSDEPINGILAECTGVSTNGKNHLSLYISTDELDGTAGNLPALIEYGFTLKPISGCNFSSQNVATAGVYQVDEINNLSARYTGSYGMTTASVIDNDDGSCAVKLTLSGLINHSQNRNYWLLPVVFPFAVGCKFYIIDPYVIADGESYKIAAIGGAFAAETFEISFNGDSLA
jgi:lysophospholipase L1-like esterase